MSDTQNTTHKEGKLELKIEGDGVSIVQYISMDLLPSLMSLVFGSSPHEPQRLKGTAKGSSHAEATLTVGPRTSLSVAEYMQEKGPKTYPDIILTLGRYAELSEGKETFSKDDIRRLIRAARIPEPRNLSRDFGVALSRGYIQAVDDDKSFHVTRTGIELIDQEGPVKFPRGQSAPKKLRRKKRKTQSGVDEE